MNADTIGALFRGKNGVKLAAAGVLLIAAAALGLRGVFWGTGDRAAPMEAAANDSVVQEMLSSRPGPPSSDGNEASVEPGSGKRADVRDKQ